jgi:hypothetical protein
MEKQTLLRIALRIVNSARRFSSIRLSWFWQKLRAAFVVETRIPPRPDSFV